MERNVASYKSFLGIYLLGMGTRSAFVYSREFSLVTLFLRYTDLSKEAGVRNIYKYTKVLLPASRLYLKKDCSFELVDI